MESFANDLNQIEMGFFFFILFLSCVEATRLRALIDVRIFGSTLTIRKGSLIPDPSGTGRNVQRVSEASISVWGGADQTTYVNILKKKYIRNMFICLCKDRRSSEATGSVLFQQLSCPSVSAGDEEEFSDEEEGKKSHRGRFHPPGIGLLELRAEPCLSLRAAQLLVFWGARRKHPSTY